MEVVLIFIIVLSTIAIIIKIKFNPKIFKVVTEKEVSWYLFYSIHSKFNREIARDYIVLLKIKK